MDSAYAAWVGQPVVLQVALGDIGEGWDVDIYKAMILAVEQDAMALLPA
jgi:hypothetical protein